MVRPRRDRQKNAPFAMATTHEGSCLSHQTGLATPGRYQEGYQALYQKRREALGLPDGSEARNTKPALERTG